MDEFVRQLKEQANKAINPIKKSFGTTDAACFQVRVTLSNSDHVEDRR